MNRRFLQIFFGVVLVIGIILIATREPGRPALPKWEVQEKILEMASEEVKAIDKKEADAALVRALLKEDLSDRTFEFGVVAEAVSGNRVIPARGRESSERIVGAIGTVMGGLLEEMNAEESPVRGLRRINEGSKFFEEGLLEALDGLEGISCEIPKTRGGVSQRSGYPDLKITDEASGDVYYLDPKLMERGSVKSSLRTFYFEPKDETLKITEDASHLLIGIEHDGNDGKWEFLGYRIVDLSSLEVRLKAEFQASNKELYFGPSVLESSIREGKDDSR